jgi:hypothetical protein
LKRGFRLRQLVRRQVNITAGFLGQVAAENLSLNLIYQSPTGSWAKFPRPFGPAIPAFSAQRRFAALAKALASRISSTVTPSGAAEKNVELLLLLGREHRIERLQSFIKQRSSRGRV